MLKPKLGFFKKAGLIFATKLKNADFITPWTENDYENQIPGKRNHRQLICIMFN